MKSYKNMKKRLSNDKGSAVIEFAIGLMIFVILVSFTVDLLLVGSKRFNIGQEATDISRILAKQGGVLKETPEGYPGGDEAYLNTNEMLAKIEDRMLGSGLGTYNEGIWSVTLTEYDTNGNQIRTGTLTPETHFDVDYMHSMDVRINASYSWKLMNVIFGRDSETSKSNVGAKRHAVSEFKYDFDTWEGEEY